MMRWLLLLAASCAQRDVSASDLPDAGAGASLLISVADPVIVVARGSTFQLRVNVSAHGTTDASVAFGPLPSGITATQSAWHEGSSSVTLDITAAVDAPEGELPVEIRALSNGFIVGSTTVELESSDVIGAIDPTFGDGGQVVLPGTFITPLAMAQKSDGSFVIAGRCSPLQACVQHIDASGTVGVFGAYPNVQNALVAAVASDGRAAVAAHESSADTIIEFDDTGNATSVGGALPQITALAWDGDALFAAGTGQLFHFSANGNANAPSLIGITSLETIAPGRALVGGVASQSATVAAATASSTQITFGSLTKVAGPANVTNTITNTNGETLVKLADDVGTVLRIDPNGNVMTTWTSGQVGSFVVALPNDEPLVAGTASLSTTLGPLQYGIVQRFDAPTFGVLGHSVVRFGGDTGITAAVPDANGDFLYITGFAGTAKTVPHGYLARIRLK